MSGKGDRPRNCYSDRFRDGWDRIFGGDGKSTGGLTGGESSQDGGSTPPASTKCTSDTEENR